MMKGKINYVSIIGLDPFGTVKKKKALRRKMFFKKNWFYILSFLIVMASLAFRFYKDWSPAPPAKYNLQQELAKSNLQQELAKSNLQQELAKCIQGQELAIELLSDAVLAWERSEPLVVMAVGWPSTGKRSLAQQLALQLLDASASSSPSCSSSSSPTVFHIQGLKTKYYKEREYRQVKYQLWKHFQLYPNGSLILWSDVDQSDPHYGGKIMDEIIKTSYTNSNIIMYMTCDENKSNMMRVLMQYVGENNWRSPGLLADLHRNANSPWWASSSSATASTIVYLPFAPHTQATLREIVHAYVVNHQRRKIADTKAIVVEGAGPRGVETPLTLVGTMVPNSPEALHMEGRQHDHDDDASTLLSSEQVDKLLANVEYSDLRTASGKAVRTIAVDGAAAIPFHKLQAMMMMMLKEEETTTTLDSKGWRLQNHQAS